MSRDKVVIDLTLSDDDADLDEVVSKAGGKPMDSVKSQPSQITFYYLSLSQNATVTKYVLLPQFSCAALIR